MKQRKNQSNRLFFRSAGGVAAIIYGFVCLLAFTACSAASQPAITIDLTKPKAAANPYLFGQNIPFALSGMWDSRTNGISAGAESLIHRIAPTAIRFPGGSLSDLYLWEDGLSNRTTSPVKPGDTNVSLADTPNWIRVGQARFLDVISGQFGDRLTFSGNEGTTLMGIGGFAAPHPVGTSVRPESRPGQPEWFNNCYGIDEHMRFADSTGALPVLTVNFSTGLDKTGQVSTSASLDQRIKRAAAWVAYLNGEPGDIRPLGIDPEGNDWKTVGYWAQKRVDRGRQAPWRAIWWEIGNELYSRSEVGCTTARDYGKSFILFAQAMKTVDPAIKVGAVGMSRSDWKGEIDTLDKWNETVLNMTRDVLDYVIVHPYYPSAVQSQAPFDGETWYKGVMAGAWQAYAHLKDIRSLIDKICPRSNRIELAITEYGIWPADSQEARDFSSLARAIYDADLLMILLQHGKELGVSLATGWNLHSNTKEALIRYDWKTDTRVARPQFYAFELARRFIGLSLAETRIDCPPFSSSRFGNMDAQDDVPVLNALAGVDPTGRLILLVVNRSLQDPVTASINLRGFRPRPAASVRCVTGRGPGANNEVDPTSVIPTPGDLRRAWPTFSYKFPACSLTQFEFEPEP
ncbi:MAG: hypothetical protein HQK60_11605 [Deltaproteobacteria bacterium]|nr:hypothetical protein [Deltaproteobacteria bacterium]